MIPIRVIRRRIRSIQNTAKITKAMEMIAASKMRRAQQRVLSARPYADKMREVLADLASQQEEELHPLLVSRKEIKHIGLVLITSDRGLCGGLNANINRKTGAFVLDQKAPVQVIGVGKKGSDFMARSGQHLRAEFGPLGDKPGIIDIAPIARTVIDDYVNGEVDQVYLSYTRFVSTMNQQPVLRQLLPIQAVEAEGKKGVEYIYEPSSTDVYAQLLPRYIEMQVYHAILESIASEQSARMVAMRSATDNAKEMIEGLTLTYNKARQELITKELLDIAGGVASLE